MARIVFPRYKGLNSRLFHVLDIFAGKYPDRESAARVLKRRNILVATATVIGWIVLGGSLAIALGLAAQAIWHTQ
jgi:hypothetical protein